MDNLIEQLGLWVVNNPAWTKFIISAGIIIQGEITVLLSLFLVVQKSLTFWEFATTALIALFVGEICVYFLGKALRNTRFGWRIYRKIKGKRKIQLYTYYLRQNTWRVFITAKFIPGLNLIMLLLLGWTKITFKKFIKIHIPIALFWFAVTSTAAYFINSGLHYLRTEKIFENIEYIILGIIILFFLLEYVAKKLIFKIPEKFINDENGE